MKLLNTGEIIFPTTDLCDHEKVIREINIEVGMVSYIFIEDDYNALIISELGNTPDISAITPFNPIDAGSCHKMYQLTEEVLLRLSNEIFDVKKTL